MAHASRVFPMLSSRADVRRRDRRRRHLHRSERGRRGHRPRRRHQGAVRAAGRGRRRRGRARGARHRGPRRAAARPRHDRRHQRRSRAARRARGDPHDRRLPRLDRDRPHQAQYPRALRADLRAPEAGRRAQAPLRGRRAARGRRRRPGAARWGERRARARRRGGRRRRGLRGVPPSRLPEPGARAGGGRRGEGPVPGASRVLLGRRRRRVPRVRALLDDGAQRLSAAPDGRLPRRARRAAARHRLRSRRSHCGFERRHDDDGDGAPPADQDDLLGPGRRREPGVLRRRRRRRAGLHHLRHGRHLDRRLPGPRSRAADDVRRHARRFPRQGSPARHAQRRRRRRLDRVARRGRQPSGRAAERRSYAGPGRLRSGRHRADGHRRERRARPHRDRQAPRRQHHARRRARPGGRRRSRQALRSVDDGRGARRGDRHDRHRADDLRDPRDLDPARARPPRFHADRLRRRRAHARARTGPGDRNPAGARAAAPRELLGARPPRVRHQARRRQDARGAAARAPHGRGRVVRRDGARRAASARAGGIRHAAAADFPLARPALPRPGFRAERGPRRGRARARRHRGGVPPPAPRGVRSRERRRRDRAGERPAHRLRPRREALRRAVSQRGRVDRRRAGRAPTRLVRWRAARLPGVGARAAARAGRAARPRRRGGVRRDHRRAPGLAWCRRRARQPALRAGGPGVIDPITLEVLREALVSIVREMRVTLVRTAYSSILYEGEDFSCVLMDGHAQIVAMSKGQDHPLHIVPIGWSVKAVREKFGDDIHPGDIFLHNEPYTGGTHLNDVAMIYPLWAPDGELFVFPVVRAHWGDVGGMSPGSLSGRATEIFQEGVRIPPIKIADRGRPNQAALDLIFSNMRGPRERRGDFQAMLGTCRKASERIEELIARYGAATIRAAVAELMDRAEGRMRRAIRGLREGEYVYEAHLEAGTDRLEPLTVRAKVVVAADTITVDLAGTSPQTAGPTNVGPAMAPTGAFTIINSFLDPGADVNSGAFRPLTILTPPGTIVNADPPAPCGGMVEVKYCVESAVMGALAQALDGKVAGDLKGGGNHCYVGGPHPRTGETFIFYEYPAGGTGAFEGGDGSNTVRTWTESDMTTLQPIEAVEQLYPVRIERTALREDSGGPGRWRGGLGLTREVLIQTVGTQLSVLAEKCVLPPFGVCGGGAGATNRFWVRRNGQRVESSPLPGKVSGFPLEPGDVLLMESSGGGGFGDPLDRDPSSVVADVLEGYVTPAAAESVYGVVLHEGAPDLAATAVRRAALRAARLRVRVVAGPDLDAGRGRAIRLDAETAARLGVQAGAVVELVNPRGAPLRAWVAD